MDLYSFMEQNHFAPLPLRHVQQIAYQLLSAASYLHSMRIIHTDLKPENIMLLEDRVTQLENTNCAHGFGTKVLATPVVSVIDFGSALFEDEYHADLVSTRHYRAPEIILEVGWSFPCDCWSIGCILMELYLGNQLFNTHDNLTHLKLMEGLLGPFPEYLVKPAFIVSGNALRPASMLSRPHYFNESNKVNFPWESTPPSSISLVETSVPLAKIIPAISPASDYFYDLIKSLLELDPMKRITSRNALFHPFFKCSIGMDE